MKNRLALVFPVSLLSAACGVVPGPVDSTDPLGSAQQQERWSASDNPALLSQNLEFNVQNLPMQGEASPIPWPGSYWPTSRDSINYRWDGPGSLSPAMKYEKAFGGSGVEDQVSQRFGVDSQLGAARCVDDSQCDSSVTEVCGSRAGRRGMSVGRCIPTWYGICDGWAAASILFPEPKHDVVKNGVTFKVQDIKALLSLLLTSTRANSVSLNCTLNDARGEIRYDAYGRPTEPECRDTNPGTFHVVLANYVGMHGRSFVEDRTFDYQVWNQPIRGYKVLGARVISAEQANRLVTGGSGSYMFNSDAKGFVYMKTSLWYVLEANSETDGNLSSHIDTFTRQNVYEYVLELDGAGAIIGGEWVGSSKRDHPDFLWLPTGAGAAAVAGGAIRYDAVKDLADASVAP